MSYLKNLKPVLDQLHPMEIISTGATPDFHRDKTIKAVIFDIYGTLLISASGDIIQDSYNTSMFKKALDYSGFQQLVPEEQLMGIHRFFREEVISEKQKAREKGTLHPELNLIQIWTQTLNRAKKEGIIAFTPTSDFKAFTIIFELYSNRIWPMPGLKKTLDHLKNRKYPLGIVSNAQFYTPVIMNYFLSGSLKDDEFIDYFEKDLSVFSYKLLFGKPDPCIYRELLIPLNSRELTPQDVLYVGNDMLKDIYAASTVGFKTCFFAGDQRAYRLRTGNSEVKGLKPDHTITELSQLLNILPGW